MKQNISNNTSIGKDKQHSRDWLCKQGFWDNFYSWDIIHSCNTDKRIEIVSCCFNWWRSWQDCFKWSIYCSYDEKWDEYDWSKDNSDCNSSSAVWLFPPSKPSINWLLNSIISLIPWNISWISSIVFSSCGSEGVSEVGVSTTGSEECLNKEETRKVTRNQNN